MNNLFDIERINLLADEKRYEDLYAYIAPFAKAENPDAIAMLGICYDFGYGVQQNETMALECFQKAATMDSVYGLFHYGWYLCNSSEEEKDAQEKGQKNLLRASEQGCVPAYYELGQLTARQYYPDEKDSGLREQMHKNYQYAAEAGYLPAQLDLGNSINLMYSHAVVKFNKEHEDERTPGDHVTFEERKQQAVAYLYQDAVKWYRIAAESNNAEAQAQLGELLRKYKETEEEGIRWLEKAGACMPLHFGVDIDQLSENQFTIELYTPEPLCWLNRKRKKLMMIREQNGDWEIRHARFSLGLHYKSRDDAKSLYWFEREIEIDPTSAISHTYLGIFYYYGRGTAIDYDRAFSHFNAAYREDPEDAEVLFYLALCHYYGHGTNKNLIEAYNNFAHAAKAKTREGCFAKYYQGIMLYQGAGVAQDTNAALTLMEEAASIRHRDDNHYRDWGQGEWERWKRHTGLNDEFLDMIDRSVVCGLACFFLGYLYENGKDVPQDLVKAGEYYLRGLESEYDPTEMLSVRDIAMHGTDILEQNMELLNRLQEVASRKKEMEKNLDAFKSISKDLAQANANLDKLQHFIRGLKESKGKPIDHPVEGRSKEDWEHDVLIEGMSYAINGQVEGDKSTHAKIAAARAYLKDTIFGELWYELQPATQKSLITSHVYYSLLGEEFSQDIDYSGVCITAFAALENELKIRLVDGYANYLMCKNELEEVETFPDTWPPFMRGDLVDKDWPAKGFKVRDKLTLGNVSYFLRSHKGEHESTMKAYLETIKRDGIQIASIIDHLSHKTVYTQALLDLRNGAAHSGNISYKLANRCKPVLETQNEGEEAKRTVLGLIYELVSLTRAPKIEKDVS